MPRAARPWKSNCCVIAPGWPDEAGAWSGTVIDCVSANRRFLALWFPFLSADRLRLELTNAGAVQPEGPLAFVEKARNVITLSAVGSEARRVGNEWVRRCRSWWSPAH